MLGVQWKRGNFFRNFLLWNGVRWARLELAQDYSHYPLKVACLPFHHHRFVLGLQIYAQFLQVQTFLRFFCKKVNFYAENQLIKLFPPGNLRKTQERHSHSQPFFFLELTCYVRKQDSCRIINLCITPPLPCLIIFKTGHKDYLIAGYISKHLVRITFIHTNSAMPVIHVINPEDLSHVCAVTVMWNPYSRILPLMQDFIFTQNTVRRQIRLGLGKCECNIYEKCEDNECQWFHFQEFSACGCKYRNYFIILRNFPRVGKHR